MPLVNFLHTTRRKHEYLKINEKYTLFMTEDIKAYTAIRHLSKLTMRCPLPLLLLNMIAIHHLSGLHHEFGAKIIMFTPNILLLLPGL